MLPLTGNGGENLAKNRVAAPVRWSQSRTMKTTVSGSFSTTRFSLSNPRLPIPAMLISAILLLAAPVSSPGADFVELLSGKTFPLSVKLGELDSQWRRITLQSAGSANGNISVSVSGNGTSGSSQNNIADLAGNKLYLTKGHTVSVNDQTYLVAYRLPGGPDLQAMIQAMATKSPAAVTALTAERALPLALLDVRSMGSLDQVRAFDLKREIAESEKLVQTFQTVLKAASAGSTNSAAQPAANKSGK